MERLTVQADYWRDVAAREDGSAAESAQRMVRLIEAHLRLLRLFTPPGTRSTEEQRARPCPRPARRPGRCRAPVRTAVAEQLRRAEGWPLSTVEVCTRLGRRSVGHTAVYTALRSLEGAGLCVRLRGSSVLGGRALYWCSPDSPFATGWGDQA
jgi:hypothetical protein